METPHSSEELSLKASVLGTSTGTGGTEINHGPCSKDHLQIGEKDLEKMAEPYCVVSAVMEILGCLT